MLLEPDVFQDLSSQGLSLPHSDFEPDEELRLESGHERQFVINWVRKKSRPWRIHDWDWVLCP